MKGVIFDIQFDCIYDGPGIRTTVFFKGCPLRCDWCHNPESRSGSPQAAWSGERCLHCGACVDVCESGAAVRDEKGVAARMFDQCVSCGRCVEVCPSGASEMIGREVEVDEIVELCLRDKAFYQGSGGGVTVSGGEPAAQPDFLVSLLDALRAEGVHTAVETSGWFPPEFADRLAASADLILFDIKHADDRAHQARTGVETQRIRENFARLLAVAGSERVLPRVPLVPGFNTDRQSVMAIAGLLTGAGYSGPVHLMPFNPLAGSKWEKIGEPSPYEEMPRMDDDELSEVIALFEAAGFEVEVNH